MKGRVSRAATKTGREESPNRDRALHDALQRRRAQKFPIIQLLNGQRGDRTQDLRVISTTL